ncbi:MAG: aspartyl protease family protein [Acidobacteriota bacterium]|nr:aspartyl protease family protein [Acidobacteriota bacterium]
MRRASGIVLAIGVVLAAGIIWRADVIAWLMNRVIYAEAGAGLLPADFTDVVLPFELVNEHIFLVVRVNNSRPLQFMLDTGAKYTIVDLDLAQELGLPLGTNIPVSGVGPQSVRGAMVKDGRVTLGAFPGFTDPVALAISLRGLAPLLGHDLDGILGNDFMSKFVVEVDYQRRTVTLHNRLSFRYSGPGEAIPIRFTATGHPAFHGAVQARGPEELPGEFELDLGAGGALDLHRPFVEEHHLPPPGLSTVPDIGSAGTGGETSGVVGRITAFRIGRFEMKDMPVVFSRDTSGSAAGANTQGSIGEETISRFRLFLDYERRRVIFEPNARYAEKFDRAYSGVLIAAEGKDYKTIRITRVVPGSPGAESGLEEGDVIVAANGQSTSSTTFSDVVNLLRRTGTVSLNVNHGGQPLAALVKPRELR